MGEKIILFTGATRNFFKVGHAAIHYISKNYPNVTIRLAVPDIEGAKPACQGVDVDFFQWEPERPETLDKAFEGCSSMLLVPPIKDRVNIGTRQVDAALKAGVAYIACIGIQYTSPEVKLANDVKALDKILMASGIRYCTMRLPMFLENLLYQTRSIKKNNTFFYPCRPNSKFSYIACKDLAPLISDMLVNQKTYVQTEWVAERQTTCIEIASILSSLLHKKIMFKQIDDEAFIKTLLSDGGSASSRDAAEGILQLWKKIDEGKDLIPNLNYRDLTGDKPQDISDWLEEHVCCFSEGLHCKHPQPPFSH